MSTDLAWRRLDGMWRARMTVHSASLCHRSNEVEPEARDLLSILRNMDRFGPSPELCLVEGDYTRRTLLIDVEGKACGGTAVTAGSEGPEPTQRESQAANGFVDMLQAELAPSAARGRTGHDHIPQAQPPAPPDPTPASVVSSPLPVAPLAPEVSLLGCPKCSVPVPDCSEQCPSCGVPLHPAAVPCPGCGTTNLIVLDDDERACSNRACGEHLSAARLLDRAPAISELLKALRATSTMVRFQLQRTQRQERRIDYVVESHGEPALVFLVPPRILNQPIPVQSRRESWGIPDCIVLPTDVRPEYAGGDTLIYYPPITEHLCDFTTWARRHPAKALWGLLQLHSQVHAANYCLPALLRDDLVVVNDVVLLRHGHRLVAADQVQPPTRRLSTDAFDSNDLPRSALLQAALLWYEALVPDLLGLSGEETRLEEFLLSPRIRCPELPVGLWCALQPVVDTNQRWTPEEALAVLETRAPGQVVELGAASDVGHKRDGNQEDRYDSLPWRGGHLIAVADGVSRSGWGEVAAELAVHAQLDDPPMEDGPQGVAASMRARVQAANEDIGRYILDEDPSRAQADGQFEFSTCMSATVTAAYVLAHHATIVALGDSPSLLIRRRGIEILTADHSQRVLEVANGATIQSAWHQDGATSLERYVGAFEFADPSDSESERIDPARPLDLRSQCQSIQVPLQSGDVLVLCSDGITDFLSLLEVRDTVLYALDSGAQAAAEALVRHAVSQQPRGRGDNATAIVIVVDPLPVAAHPDEPAPVEVPTPQDGTHV